MSSAAARAQARRLPDSYWLAEPPEWQLANARQMAAAEARIGDAVASVRAEGLEPSVEGLARLEAVAADEMTEDEAIAALDRRHRR